MARFIAFAQRDRRSAWIAGVIIVLIGSGIIFLGSSVYRLATQLAVISGSPDTTPQIAYLSDIAGSRNETLYLLNLKTGISQQITRGGKLQHTMRWLPDSQTLELADDGQVRLLNLTTAALTDTGQTLQSWSADGRVVLYESKNDKNEWSWKAYDPATRNSAQVTSEIVTLPALTPDGKSVAFATNRHLYLINTDGTNKRQFLAEQGKDGFAVQWSPDGKHLLLETAEYDPQFGAVSRLVLSVGDADGSNLVPFGKAYHAGTVAWSPDSSKIAWTSDKELNPCVANANGTGVACANGKDTVGLEILRWSLDSTQIAYLIDETSGSGFAGFAKPRICTMSASTMDKPQCYTVTGSDYTQMDLTWRP